MAEFGPNSPGTMADDATVGTQVWTNPGNAVASDNAYANSVVDGSSSHYLKATNFGFSIPAGATVNGILVEIERHMSGSDINDVAVKIVKADGTIGTTNKVSGTGWVTTLNTYYSYGSSTDLWGETWIPADINDVDFGVVLQISSTINPSEAFVDHIRITVYYTESGVTPSPNISQAITVTDTPTVLIPELVPSVSDTITVTESIVGGLADPNVSDSITITESVVMNLINMPKVSDTVTITESTDFAFNPLLVSVSEAITVTEAINMQGLNVSESITITESLTMDLEININVSESITVTDTESTHLWYFASSTNWAKQDLNSTDWEEQPE